MSKLWKATERKHAAMIGGKRNPINGRGGNADVESERFAVESKERDSDIPGWLLKGVSQAVTAAADSDKLPLVLVHKKGDLYANDLAVMRWQDFERLLDDPVTDELDLEKEMGDDEYDYEEEEPDDEEEPSVIFTVQERLFKAIEVIAIFREWDVEGEFVLSRLPVSTLLRGKNEAHTHPLVLFSQGLYEGLDFDSTDEDAMAIAGYASHLMVAMNLMLVTDRMPLNEYLILWAVIEDTVGSEIAMFVEDAVRVHMDGETREAVAQLTDYILGVIRDEQ